MLAALSEEERRWVDEDEIRWVKAEGEQRLEDLLDIAETTVTRRAAPPATPCLWTFTARV